MAYQHGIYIQETPTALDAPVQSTSGVQVVIGTAPINLGDSSNVNKPVVANNYNEAVAAVGYSDDWSKYTICQSIDVSFKVFGVAPLVIINVLDPSKHNSAVTKTLAISNSTAVVDDIGVLLDSIVLKSTDAASPVTYDKDKDYTAAFNSDGKPVISIIEGGKIADSVENLNAEYKIVDTSKVVENDIIVGMDAVKEVYPRYNLIPGLIIAPGWSHIPDIEKALKQHNELINGNFNAEVLTDIDCKTVKTKDNAIKWKKDNNYMGNREIALWPMISVQDKKYRYSAFLAAFISWLDAQNDNVPYKSPSNKKIAISGTILEDGTEVFLDQLDANSLNENGIVTAINMAGWRTWGNNTAAYPLTADPKDRWIAVRRVFDWWGNNFVVDFFDKVDDPTNYRLIESVVDEENLKANGYQAAGKLAGAKITFNQADNPISNILDGKIIFKQTIGAYTPAESITNVLSFDPNLVQSALSGQGGNE